MILRSELEKIIYLQKQKILEAPKSLERDLLGILPINLKKHAMIISGIRRCGKSTLLRQLMDNEQQESFFLNFDTPQLYDFQMRDFALLDSIIKKNSLLYFDEIQVIEGWELYVRQKLDEGYKVRVTGSNASLLSRELGTKLTGRHISKELFPFSYTEFLRFRKKKANLKSFIEFLNHGGFPEYLEYLNQDILTTLFEDILYRDIVVRYNIRTVSALKRLLLHLIGNVGNLMTATKLLPIMNIKSTTTILEYLSYFESSYLLGLLPKFSYSYRAQAINPRKVYINDNGIVNAVSPSFTDDYGRKLENVVYWELRSRRKELYYFNESGRECDFIVKTHSGIEDIIQVCYDFNQDNETREIKGIIEAMKFFKKDEATIVTMDQNDEIYDKGKYIRVIPAYEYFQTLSFE